MRDSTINIFFCIEIIYDKKIYKETLTNFNLC